MRTELLRLREYETKPVEDEIVQLVDETFWEELAVTVSRKPGDQHWTLKADARSGIARYRAVGIDLTVVIEPKLKHADVLFLADHSYGQRGEVLRRPKAARVGIDSTYSDPIAALLVWYVESLAEFATRWLRRSYRSREVVLHGQVRGRFLVSKYVSHSLATARNADVPCIITERTVDTPNNRVLKAGLREVAVLSSALAVPAARKAVKAAVNAALPLFAEVSDVHIGPTEMRATSTRGPERHYASILETTTDLLGGRHLGAASGTSQVSSFLWEMPALFQEALRGIISESDGFALDSSKRPSAVIRDSTGRKLRASRIDPDYVLRVGNGVTLLDAKYKEALRLPGSDDESLIVGTGGPTVKVSRSDIYQMVAYRQQPAWQGADVGLVFPVVLGTGEALPAPYEVQGIGAVVRLYFMDIGPNARTNLRTFLGQITPASTKSGVATLAAPVS